MTAPIHRWKERVTYGEGFNGKSPHWTFDGKPCWLASGLYDRNGKEIFEGDILLWFSFGGKAHKLPVSFRDGCFCYKDIDGEYYPLELNNAKNLEVIGHIAEGKQ